LPRFEFAPTFDCFGGTPDHSEAAAVPSESTPSALAAFRIYLPEGVIFAHPASAQEKVGGYSPEANSENVAPKAVAK
jgi:hypothetical protein